MERELNTSHITAKFILHTLWMLTHGAYKLSDSEFKTSHISLILKPRKFDPVKIKHFIV